MSLSQPLRWQSHVAAIMCERDCRDEISVIKTVLLLLFMIDRHSLQILFISMSQNPFPVSKRNLSAGGAVRGAKKAYSPSLYENVEVQPSEGSAKSVNSIDDVGSSCVANVDAIQEVNGDHVMNPEQAYPPSPVLIVQGSPGSNRARFHANCQPMRVSCDLTTVGLHSSSSRFSFQAIILVVYPASEKPDRRHLQLIDSRGSTGITIWGEHVKMFSSATVGQMVKFTKLCMITHNGQKNLSMCRDSSAVVLSAGQSEEGLWWSSLLQKSPLRIISVHDAEDNTLVNVAGVVGLMTTETKKVKNATKDLLCIRLTDRTGCIDIRSWNHSEAELSHLMDAPVLFKRVRVTSFAGTKILELLEGAGTEMTANFSGAADLISYWNE